MRRAMMALGGGCLAMVVAGAWAADLKDEFAKIWAAYDAAILTGDKAALDQLYDASGLFIDSEGRLFDKAGAIADLTKRKYETAKTTDQSVQAVADTVAVETGIFTATGRKADGGTFRDHLRYVDVWVKKGGRWVIVAEQVTSISDQSKQ